MTGIRNPDTCLQRPQNMSACKPPEVILHKFFQDNESDTEEILDCVVDFLDGDPGILAEDAQVLGFLSRTMRGKTRHGVYETSHSGRIHVIGDNTKILAMPDLVFAKARADHQLLDLNLCEGEVTLSHKPSKQTQTKKARK